MTFAIAQTQPKDTVEENLRDHCGMIDVAGEHRADLIIFPEMSMTGYTRDNADELAFDINDVRLGPLRSATASHRIITVAGAPIRMNGTLYIGSFVLFPDHSQSLYLKQSCTQVRSFTSAHPWITIRSFVLERNGSRWPFAQISINLIMAGRPPTAGARSTARASSSPGRGCQQPMTG